MRNHFGDNKHAEIRGLWSGAVGDIIIVDVNPLMIDNSYELNKVGIYLHGSNQKALNLD